MGVMIQVRDFIATIDQGIWQSPDDGFVEVVEIFTFDRIENYTPWPDYTLAEMAAKALGGKIIEATDPPKFVAGRVY